MSFRYEKRLPGFDPIRKVTGLTDPDDIEEFKGLMVTLARSRRKLVEMFVSGELSATALLAANREEGGLAHLQPDPRVLVPLWGPAGAIEKALAKHPKPDGETVRRYRVSMKRLENECRSYSPFPRIVRDLERVPWDRVAEWWRSSPSDWMALYRALSHFLTIHFGGRRTGKAHPFRLAVMDLLPRKKERKRVPAISPALFARLVSLTPDYAQPCYHALLVTGFRVRSEYLRLTREHLRPQVFEVEVPGTKTEESAAVIPIAPECWPLLDAAVPSPLAYGQIRRWWALACLAEGIARKAVDPHTGRMRYYGPTLHDIRHLTGQFMTNAGVPESMVQAYLRHSDPGTTRRYTIQAIRAEAATAMARVVGVA